MPFNAPLKRGAGGRPHYDRVMMFKVLVRQRHYHLSDDETEYQIADRHPIQGLSYPIQRLDSSLICMIEPGVLAEEEKRCIV